MIDRLTRLAMALKLAVRSDLEALTRQFLVEVHPNLNTHSCDATKGRCDGVSSRLHHWLADQGVESTLVEGRGLIPPLGAGANTDWVDFVAGDLTNSTWPTSLCVSGPW